MFQKSMAKINLLRGRNSKNKRGGGPCELLTSVSQPRELYFYCRWSKIPMEFFRSWKSWTWHFKNSLTWFLSAFLQMFLWFSLDSCCSQRDWWGKCHSPKGYSILSQICLKRLTRFLVQKKNPKTLKTSFEVVSLYSLRTVYIRQGCN